MNGRLAVPLFFDWNTDKCIWMCCMGVLWSLHCSVTKPPDKVPVGLHLSSAPAVCFSATVLEERLELDSARDTPQSNFFQRFSDEIFLQMWSLSVHVFKPLVWRESRGITGLTTQAHWDCALEIRSTLCSSLDMGDGFTSVVLPSGGMQTLLNHLVGVVV